MFSQNCRDVKKQKLYEKERVVFEHGKKGVFCLFCFEVLMVSWFVFLYVGKVAKVLKCLFFLPRFFGFGGGLFLFFLGGGFGRFRRFCVSCFCLYFV